MTWEGSFFSKSALKTMLINILPGLPMKTFKQKFNLDNFASDMLSYNSPSQLRKNYFENIAVWLPLFPQGIDSCHARILRII